MSLLIDRRQQASKKHAVNRQRFMRRCKAQIQQAVSEAINQRSITNIAAGEQVRISSKSLSEPRFSQGKGGYLRRVLPGNDVFVQGDHISRPSAQEGGAGSEAGDQGEGEDDFIFELTRDEFLDMYFEELALPDLMKKELARLEILKTVRAGFTHTGIPTNLNILRSMRQSTARRMALLSPYRAQCQDLEAALVTAEAAPVPDKVEIERLQTVLQSLKQKMQRIPYIDTLDLRYNHRVVTRSPSTQAVMFCIMDVSGSMDEPKKEVAKRFFILLYLFLTRHYETIDLVFIRHHTSAKEVNEQDFFYSRETGGTVVSSALTCLQEIMRKRYPSNAWNCYVAQASDGDNWNADSPHCLTLLRQIIPLVQYYAYVEIMPQHHQSLWEVYQQAKLEYPQFAMESIDSVKDIYPVFHDLFKRQT